MKGSTESQQYNYQALHLKTTSLKQPRKRGKKKKKKGIQREMAQVSKICNGIQNTRVFTNQTKLQKPKSVSAISFRSQSRGSSSSWGLRYNERLGNNNTVRTVRASASVGTAEKQSKASEIVLQPIREISGTVTLPGSKSLSNRILLLAALSEVCVFQLFFFFFEANDNSLVLFSLFVCFPRKFTPIL